VAVRPAGIFVISGSTMAAAAMIPMMVNGGA
jgi:hypothetical protein